METILITGANRGLGLELAKQYAHAGWRVLATCRKPEEARELKGLSVENKNVTLHAMDVSDFSQIETLAKQLAGTAIDVVLSGAGIVGKKFNATNVGTAEDWSKIFLTNSVATMKIAQAFHPSLVQGKRKQLIAITSLMGSIGDNQAGGYYDYRASKAALNMIVKGLSLEFKSDGITCVVVHPGWVKTDMGGKEATLEIETSCKSMKKVFDSLSFEANGKFLNYDGKPLPW